MVHAYTSLYGPLLVVLDDLHAFDAASWGLLAHLVPSVPSLLVVAALRPNDDILAPATVSDVGPSRLVVQMWVGPGTCESVSVQHESATSVQHAQHAGHGSLEAQQLLRAPSTCASSAALLRRQEVSRKGARLNALPLHHWAQRPHRASAVATAHRNGRSRRPEGYASTSGDCAHALTARAVACMQAGKRALADKVQGALQQLHALPGTQAGLQAAADSPAVVQA